MARNSEIKKEKNSLMPLEMREVEDRITFIRNQEVIADADVAFLYGVQTKEVNQAVRNNNDKFPVGYMFELTPNELRELRSKILTTKVSVMNRNPTKVFTEKGLYMLATILNRRTKQVQSQACLGFALQGGGRRQSKASVQGR